jgi:hypothetical protein
MKPVGKPDAGNPHVRFDERGEETESLSANLCAGHNQRQGGVLCQAEPKSWTAP